MYGQTMNVITLQRKLKELNPDMRFDIGANLGLYHPRLNEWLGVYHGDNHITSMDRGPDIPEYTVYALVQEIEGWPKVRGKVLRIGWRHTCEHIVKHDVPGITWARLCLLLGVDEKKYNEHAGELEVA